MKLTDRQQQFPIPWASMPESGTFSSIPKDDPGDGSASLTKGFPKATMTPIAAGGKPPRGDQFNGIFNQLSLSAQNNDVGVIPAWNVDFSQAIGGYPITAQVTIIKNGVPDILVSICDNNLDNPNDSHQKNWMSIRKGLALTSDLSGYQTKGNYITQNDPNLPVDSNGNIGVAWAGYHPSDGTFVLTVPKNPSNQYPIIGLPIGTIVMIDSDNVPSGWLQLAGQSFDSNTYPALYQILGRNTLSDYRGRFPRGSAGSWINVPGIGTQQGDTIRNITGTIWHSNPQQATSQGVFSVNGSRVDGAVSPGNWGLYSVDFNASNVVPTDWENRPYAIISNFIIKAK